MFIFYGLLFLFVLVYVILVIICFESRNKIFFAIGTLIFISVLVFFLKKYIFTWLGTQDSSDKIQICAVIIYALTLILSAIVAIFGDRIKKISSHPNLELYFENAFPSTNLTSVGGCEYTLLTHQNTNCSFPPQLELYTKTEVRFECYYYRLKLINNGNVDAENVQIMINKCERYDNVAKKYNGVNNFLPMNLCWAYHEKRTPLEERIAPKMEKYCDFMHIINDHLNELILDTQTWVDSNGKDCNILEKGKYRVELMYGASNFETKKIIICFEYTGNWNDKENQIKIIKE